MTTLTLDGVPSARRRHVQRRHVGHATNSAVSPRLASAAPTDADFVAQAAWPRLAGANAALPRGVRAYALPLAALALLAHIGVIYFLQHDKHTDVVVQQPKIPPMSVALTAPVPLPQAPAPTPPAPQQHTPPPKHVAVRHAVTPTPAPTPAPQAAPTPVATPAPAQPVVAVAPAPVSPQPPAPAKPVEKIVGPIGNAAYLHNPPPDYPEMARDEGWEGRVILKVHVLASGKPDSVDVQTSSGHSALDRAAVAAVKQWAFVPAKRGDTPIDGWVNVPLVFSLGD